MHYFKLLDLSLGQVGLVWRDEGTPVPVTIILREKGISLPSLIRQSFPKAEPCSHACLDDICHSLEEYDRGKEIFSLFPESALTGYTEFQRRVWRETARIPRGQVSTYGRVAENISVPRAARAVGTALGQNPLPLLISCHRVVRTNGELGGFSGGGIAMKQRLLEGEGIRFDRQGRITNLATSLCS